MHSSRRITLNNTFQAAISTHNNCISCTFTECTANCRETDVEGDKIICIE